jgi:hypothetical protein
MFNLFSANQTASHKLGTRTLSKRFNFEEISVSEPNDGVECQPPIWEILNKQNDDPPFERYNPSYKLPIEPEEKPCDLKQQFVKPNIQKKVSSKKFSLKELIVYKVVKDKIEAVPK